MNPQPRVTLSRKDKIIGLCILFASACLIVLSCKSSSNQVSIEKYKAEIREAEKAFARHAKEKNVKAAFLAFGAEDAVLLRGNKLIRGKKAIAEYFNNQTLQNIRLEWEPDFIYVSESGDLAYTYGEYQFSATDNTGKAIADSGYFHTVWKRQPDGTWRFVWD